ncbi:MAG: MFS transporter [Phycisphaerae bacterium]
MVQPHDFFVITDVVAFICEIMAMFVVDRIGRRIMLLGGAIGLVIVYALLGLAFHVHSHGVHVVILVIMAVAVYCFTLAPVTWVVLSEIFPNRIRGAAMAVAVFALWAADFVLTFTFPYLNQSLGTARVFWMYGGTCVLGVFFIYSVLPETKGKTLEQIETRLVG